MLLLDNAVLKGGNFYDLVTPWNSGCIDGHQTELYEKKSKKKGDLKTFKKKKNQIIFPYSMCLAQFLQSGKGY